jgi:hypothetical protein
MKEATNVTLSLGDRKERLRIQTWFKDGNRDAFVSGLVPSESTDMYSYHGQVWLTHAAYKPRPDLNLAAGFGLWKWTNFIDYAGTPYGGDESNYDAFVDANYTAKLSGAGKHTLLTGLKLEREGQYDSTIYTFNMSAMPASAGWIPSEEDDCVDAMGNAQACVFSPDDARTVLGLYAEDAWRIRNDLQVVAGIRGDLYRGYADQTELAPNPRIAAIWTWSGKAADEGTDLVGELDEVASAKHRLTLKALYASATRPPSIYERRGSALVPLAGSADVESERVHTFELSSIYRRGGLKLQLTPFLQLFDNKIEYVDDVATMTSIASNHGRTTSLGSDLEVTYQRDARTYAYLRGTWLSSNDRETDHRTYFLPSLYLSAGGNFGVGNVGINLNGFVRGPRELPPTHVMNRQANADSSHLVVNATASYPIVEGLRGFLLAQNVTTDALRGSGIENHVPINADGLFVPMHGLTIVVGLSYGTKWSASARSAENRRNQDRLGLYYLAGSATMGIVSRLTFASVLLAHTASAEHDLGEQAVPDGPPGSVTSKAREPRTTRPDPLATTERWGGGIRLTGLSGIGALPGRNFGGEVAAMLRRDELFVELALGRWKPEEPYVVTDSTERVDLKLDVWTLRAGFASMRMPMRGWLLAEAGELAGARGMPGVVTRMVMGDTPQQRQWRSAGAGLGVAWPMSDQARLFGSFEVAIPTNRERLMLDHGGAYEPDPLVARCSLGFEVGWR